MLQFKFLQDSLITTYLANDAIQILALFLDI